MNIKKLILTSLILQTSQGQTNVGVTTKLDTYQKTSSKVKFGDRNIKPKECLNENSKQCLAGERASVLCEFDSKTYIGMTSEQLQQKLIEKITDGLEVREQLTNTVDGFSEYCFTMLNQLLTTINANPRHNNDKSDKNSVPTKDELLKQIKNFTKIKLKKSLKAGDCQAEFNKKAIEKFRNAVENLKKELTAKWTKAYVTEQYATNSLHKLSKNTDKLINDFSQDTSKFNNIAVKLQTEMNQAEHEIKSDLGL